MTAVRTRHLGLGTVRKPEPGFSGGTARTAPGRNVDQLLVTEELLFARCPREWLTTFPTRKGFILKLHAATLSIPLLATCRSFEGVHRCQDDDRDNATKPNR